MTQNPSSDIILRPGSMDQAVYEEVQSDVYSIRKYVKGPMLVVDVGAYTGIFCRFVLSVAPDARLICLEPMPSNYAVLEENTHHLPQVTRLNAAMAGKNLSSITLYDFGLESSACHSVFKLGEVQAQAVEVPAMSLDQLVESQGISQIDFLKLDCQGSEFDIIASLSPAIQNNILYLGMEVHYGIANTSKTLGKLPDQINKKTQLYEKLLKTHVPVEGNIYKDSIQVWARRDVAPPQLAQQPIPSRNTMIKKLKWQEFMRKVRNKLHL